MNSLATPTRNQIQLVVAPHAGRDMMLALASRLAPGHVVRVLDGGNQFNAYTVSREIRRHTAALNQAMNNIRLSRGFTCYQMVVLLADTPTIPDRPVLVLDLLSTFYDESVPLAESHRLLENAIVHLRRLSRTAPVMVSARTPSALCPDRLVLLDLLRAASTRVMTAEAPRLQPIPGLI
ncbi:hypothetical protein [Leptolinea tardivitalis]|uniref:DNA recombination and repair protein Rad51-like C-terminal domain-containing protein n=1 Tax=Leptolinea tardivitalis TaxID=229920 RepID=A0A0P6XNA7_9CHLR|nr:hypothetical protein [Leptolinea tardivitalis]KPL70439.1 hypothetical protein ADM99_14960 [Leptolinea tardivitalis]GAP22022.1 hypothetical protein LTAR_02240 [Leptolinea tardivitalis]